MHDMAVLAAATAALALIFLMCLTQSSLISESLTVSAEEGDDSPPSCGKTKSSATSGLASVRAAAAKADAASASARPTHFVPRTSSPALGANKRRGGDWAADSVLVVVARDLAKPEQSVAWLKEQRYGYVIMKSGGASRHHKNHLSLSHGGPAASFMQFIVENYDNLPAVMIFTSAIPSYAGVVRGL